MTYYIVSTRKVQSYKLCHIYIVRYAVILEYEIMRDFFYFRRLRTRLDVL